MYYYSIYESPIGKITIAADEKAMAGGLFCGEGTCNGRTACNFDRK